MKRLFREEEGVTIIEYALLAALIAIAAIVAVGLAGNEVVEVFQFIQTQLSAAIN